MYSFLAIDSLEAVVDNKGDVLKSFSELYENLIGNGDIIIEDEYYSILKMSHPYNDITLLSDTIGFNTGIFRTSTLLELELSHIDSDTNVFVVCSKESYLSLLGIFKNIYTLSSKNSNHSEFSTEFNNLDSSVISENTEYILRKVAINEY